MTTLDCLKHYAYCLIAGLIIGITSNNPVVGFIGFCAASAILTHDRDHRSYQ